MKTLQSGFIAMLLLCGFISCKKEIGSDELSQTSTSSLLTETLSNNNRIGGCPECVADFTASQASDQTNAVLVLNGSKLTPAGTTITTIASTKETYTVGNVIVTVSHDAENIYFTFERNNTTGKFGSIRFFSPAAIPMPTKGDENKFSCPTDIKKIQIIRSRTALAACSAVNFSFSVNGGGKAEVAGSVTTQEALTYVLRDVCPPKCSIAVGDYRTQSRGYWRNNNGQAFLANHPSLFGLEIGSGSNTKTFTDPALVKSYLESGAAHGTPGMLPKEGTFGAQVLTLLINLKADDQVADYSKVDGKLRILVVNIDDADIAAHPSWEALKEWNGKTVAEIFTIAQKVLGGRSTEYSPSHMNELVTAINENYENGTVDTGLLTCGK